MALVSVDSSNRLVKNRGSQQESPYVSLDLRFQHAWNVETWSRKGIVQALVWASGTLQHQVSHADQVVSRSREGEHPPDAIQTAMPYFA
jgi:hypothetical protein